MKYVTEVGMNLLHRVYRSISWVHITVMCHSHWWHIIDSLFLHSTGLYKTWKYSSSHCTYLWCRLSENTGKNECERVLQTLEVFYRQKLCASDVTVTVTLCAPPPPLDHTGRNFVALLTELSLNTCYIFVAVFHHLKSTRSRVKKPRNYLEVEITKKSSLKVPAIQNRCCPKAWTVRVHLVHLNECPSKNKSPGNSQNIFSSRCSIPSFPHRRDRICSAPRKAYWKYQTEEGFSSQFQRILLSRPRHMFDTMPDAKISHRPGPSWSIWAEFHSRSAALIGLSCVSIKSSIFYTGSTTTIWLKMDICTCTFGVDDGKGCTQEKDRVKKSAWEH